MDRKSLDGWVAVFHSGTDYEANIVRDRLDDSGIPAVVLTQRDHAFNLTVGELSNVRVLVPEDQRRAAEYVLTAEPLSDAELEQAALAADPIAEKGPDRPTVDSLVDQGKQTASDDEG